MGNIMSAMRVASDRHCCWVYCLEFHWCHTGLTVWKSAVINAGSVHLRAKLAFCQSRIRSPHGDPYQCGQCYSFRAAGTVQNAKTNRVK